MMQSIIAGTDFGFEAEKRKMQRYHYTLQDSKNWRGFQ
jgi:hypothetical protein